MDDTSYTVSNNNNNLVQCVLEEHGCIQKECCCEMWIELVWPGETNYVEISIENDGQSVIVDMENKY